MTKKKQSRWERHKEWIEDRIIFYSLLGALMGCLVYIIISSQHQQPPQLNWTCVELAWKTDTVVNNECFDENLGMWYAIARNCTCIIDIDNGTANFNFYTTGSGQFFRVYENYSNFVISGHGTLDDCSCDYSTCYSSTSYWQVCTREAAYCDGTLEECNQKYKLNVCGHTVYDITDKSNTCLVNGFQCIEWENYCSEPCKIGKEKWCECTTCTKSAIYRSVGA